MTAIDKSTLAADQYINSNQVRARYGGVSPSWIFRKTHEEGFPLPASRFGGRRRYWLLSDLIEWEISKIAEDASDQHTSANRRNGAHQYPLVVR
jgi:predicted DNA-binding transcriptional regulator AlpA